MRIKYIYMWGIRMIHKAKKRVLEATRAEKKNTRMTEEEARRKLTHLLNLHGKLCFATAHDIKHVALEKEVDKVFNELVDALVSDLPPVSIDKNIPLYPGYGKYTVTINAEIVPGPCCPLLKLEGYPVILYPSDIVGYWKKK